MQAAQSTFECVERRQLEQIILHGSAPSEQLQHFFGVDFSFKTK
jgi:hypothetical protein